VLDLEPSRLPELHRLGRTHLVDRSAPGSDPGLCVAPEPRIGLEIVTFGGRAKAEIVSRSWAMELAHRAQVALEPLGGSGDGVIGALAAVGLRRGGNDGWLTLFDGMCQSDDVLSVERLLAGGIDRVEDEGGSELALDQIVDTAGRARPAVREGRKVLLVHRSESGIWRSVKPDRSGP
jgi:hypothetical protein